VKFAYQWTRKLLVAADLNTATLLGGAPTAFAKLPTEQDRTWFLKGLNKKGGYNVLDVDVDYAFVYAIEPPGAPASWPGREPPRRLSRRYRPQASAASLARCAGRRTVTSTLTTLTTPQARRGRPAPPAARRWIRT
jgi:hypothetical protein